MIYIKYNNYKNARDMVWQLLIKMEVTELPIKLKPIWESIGVRVVSYQNGIDHIKRLGQIECTAKTDGFTVLTDSGYIIFFDSTKPSTRVRFTIAHEIGHILLGHIGKGEVSLINKEPNMHDNDIESAANVVAARIIAPSCVLHFADIIDAKDIARYCLISLPAATFRSERLIVLRHRRRFLQSALEQTVYKQFLPYIMFRNPSHHPILID